MTPRAIHACVAAVFLLAADASAQVPSSGMPPPPATARIFPVAGQDATGSLTMTDGAHKLVVDLRLTGLPAGAPFALHFDDKGRCFTGMQATPGVVDSLVVSLPELRADANGAASQHFTLEGVTLNDGPLTFGRYPVGVYTTPERGGVALACGNVSLNRTIVATRSLPVSSRDEVRACMDSEDRIGAFSHRSDADKAAVESAASASTRDALLESWTNHEAEFQSALREHTRRCGSVQAGPGDRAAILQERQDAARAAQ